MEEKISKKISLNSSRKYKILYVIPSLVRGGAETILFRIASGLAGENSQFEIRVLTLLERGFWADEFEKSGVRVDCIDNPTGKFSTNFIKTLQYIRNYQPDIVHTHLWMGDRCGLTAARVAGIPNRISTLHSFEIGLPKKNLIWNWVCSRLASGMIAVSYTVKHLWTTRRFFPDKKITVIYNSSGFKVPKNINVPRHCSEQPKLLSLGRISEEKGILYSIKAMSLLTEQHQSFTFDIYGPSNYGDEYRQQLNDYIKEKHLEQVVSFKGATNNPMEVYSGYDVFVAMSLWEGFNMAAIEAMSCGLPVIASDIPVHREIFGNGASALMVPHSDAGEIAEIVKKLISDSRFYSRMSKASLERSKDFSRDSMIEAYCSYYTDLFVQDKRGYK